MHASWIYYRIGHSKVTEKWKNCLPVLKIINFQRSLDILPSNCQLCHAYWNSFKSYHWHVKYHNSWYETWFQYKFSRSFSHFSYHADIVYTFVSIGVCCSSEDKVWKTQNKHVPQRVLGASNELFGVRATNSDRYKGVNKGKCVAGEVWKAPGIHVAWTCSDTFQAKTNASS